MKRRSNKKTRGQSTVEYILMLGFGAIFSLQIAKFFNGIFRDGLEGLERNVSTEMKSGSGFTGNGNN